MFVVNLRRHCKQTKGQRSRESSATLLVKLFTVPEVDIIGPQVMVREAFKQKAYDGIEQEKISR